MEARLRRKDVEPGTGPEPKQGPRNQESEDGVQIDFSLQQLAGHFEIPEVPDAATIHPDCCQRSPDKSTPSRRWPTVISHSLSDVIGWKWTNPKRSFSIPDVLRLTLRVARKTPP